MFGMTFDGFRVCHWLCQCRIGATFDSHWYWQSQWHTNRKI